MSNVQVTLPTAARTFTFSKRTGRKACSAQGSLVEQIIVQHSRKSIDSTELHGFDQQFSSLYTASLHVCKTSRCDLLNSFTVCIAQALCSSEHDLNYSELIRLLQCCSLLRMFRLLLRWTGRLGKIAGLTVCSLLRATQFLLTAGLHQIGQILLAAGSRLLWHICILVSGL